jgi:Ribonuclease G/E
MGLVMRHRLFIRGEGGVGEIFRWSEDRLALALRETAAAASLVGAIFLGRVGAIDPSLNAAFVDLGLERPGLLPLKKGFATPTEGEAIPVQVGRDGWDEKGPRLTRSIKTSVDIAAMRAASRAPCLLVPAPPAWSRVLPELDPSEIDEVVCDRRVDVEAIRQWAERHAPELSARIGFVTARDWHPSREDALDEIAEALEEIVSLPGGGELLVEPIRTLCAIDVNSAGSGLRAFEADMAAAAEIPRQLSLRNLGGVIVVDFIDIDDKEKRGTIVARLREAAGIDPAIEWIGNMSRLGLVEIQRRRRGPGLSEMWRGIVAGKSA